MLMSIVVDNPSILKSISEIAKNNKTSENKIVEKALKKGIEILEFEEKYDCEGLAKELDDLDKEIDEGKGITVDVDKLEEHFGL